jgi:hypothetical protein
MASGDGIFHKARKESLKTKSGNEREGTLFLVKVHLTTFKD